MENHCVDCHAQGEIVSNWNKEREEKDKCSDNHARPSSWSQGWGQLKSLN